MHSHNRVTGSDDTSLSRTQNSETMSPLQATARQAFNLARLSSPRTASASQPSSLVHRRGLAGGGDHHGPPKVNLWEDPLSPSKWKEEHFVIASLTGWGLLFYGGYKLATRGKEDKQEEPKVGGAPSH